jgi:hypothetical protein
MDKAPERCPRTIVQPAAASAFNETARGCLTSIAQFEAIEKDEKPLQAPRFLKIDPSKTESWKGIMMPQLARSSPRQLLTHSRRTGCPA